MSPSRQRIVIAEFCGWKQVTPPANAKFGATPSEPLTWWYPHQLPDFLNDLNAMHEAEKHLRGTDYEYHNDVVKYDRWHAYQHYLIERYGASATAAQRAEALIRCIGRWEE